MQVSYPRTSCRGLRSHLALITTCYAQCKYASGPPPGRYRTTADISRRMSAPPPPSVTAAGVPPLPDGAATMTIGGARPTLGRAWDAEAVRSWRFLSGHGIWRRSRSDHGHAVLPAQLLVIADLGRRPQQDSNLRSRLRRPLLSPLSYGGYATWERVPASGRSHGHPAVHCPNTCA
jgi:hypothetical protein